MDILGILSWYLLGLLFVYLHLWFQPEVDETLLGPIIYIKSHLRSAVFALLTFTVFYAAWMTAGVNVEINGETVISLEKGKPNALTVSLLGYASSSIFNTIAAKYQKIRQMEPDKSINDQ